MGGGIIILKVLAMVVLVVVLTKRNAHGKSTILIEEKTYCAIIYEGAV